MEKTNLQKNTKNNAYTEEKGKRKGKVGQSDLIRENENGAEEINTIFAFSVKSWVENAVAIKCALFVVPKCHYLS